MTHKPGQKGPIRKIEKKSMFRLGRVLVLKLLPNIFPNLDAQTHPVVNVAIYLDNLKCLEIYNSPLCIIALFCFKHT